MRRPAPLWPAWNQVARRLAAAPRLALFFDFDGTLAPIARHPARARLPARTRQRLVRLAKLPRVVVGVVSGRSLEDLRRRLRLPGIYYIGSHGLEWAGPGGLGSRRVNARCLGRIREIWEELAARFGRLPGVYVERKSISLAVHYRNAPRAVARRVQRAVRRLAEQLANSVRLLKGKKILELLPPGEMDKGLAVRKLAARLGRRWGRRPLVVYVGDDVTDESVFRRLQRSDLGIHVGGNETSRARYSLESPREVTRFLRRVEEVVG